VRGIASPGKTKLVRGSNVESRFAPAQSQHIFPAVRWRLDFARVQKQSCVVAKPKRQNSRNSRLAAFFQSVPKVLVYDALATLNRDFEQVLADLERLEGLRLFPLRWQRKVLKAWRAALEETRASVNFEVVEILHQREERDWAGFGRIRQRLEKPSEVPPDRLIPTKSSVPSPSIESDAIRFNRGHRLKTRSRTASDSCEPTFESSPGRRLFDANFSPRNLMGPPAWTSTICRK
jgi:hypothetical protein